MSTRRSASGVGATALLLSALGFSIFTVAMIARNGLADVSWGVPGAAGLWAVAYAVAGYLIAINRPRNPIGWMMLTGGMLASMMGASIEYLGALDTSDLFGRAAAMVAASAWISVFGLLSASILKFPRRSTPVQALEICCLVARAERNGVHGFHGAANGEIPQRQVSVRVRPSCI